MTAGKRNRDGMIGHERGRNKMPLPAETSRRLFLKMVMAAGLGLVIPAWAPRHAEAAFRVGDMPPKTTLVDLQGNHCVIPADLRGKVALIHFWASWCPACRGEMVGLEAVYRRYRGKGILPCSIGIGEKRESVQVRA